MQKVYEGTWNGGDASSKGAGKKKRRKSADITLSGLFVNLVNLYTEFVPDEQNDSVPVPLVQGILRGYETLRDDDPDISDEFGHFMREMLHDLSDLVIDDGLLKYIAPLARGVAIISTETLVSKNDVSGLTTSELENAA